MVSLGELRGLLSLEDAFTPTLKLAAHQLETNADKMSNIGSKLTSAGTALTAAFTLPLAAVGVTAIKTGMEFERSLNSIQGVLQTTGGEMDAVRAKAIELGAATAFSAKDAADAMLELGKAGFTVEEAIGGTGDVLELAAASGLSMGQAAELAARSMRGFGLEVGDLGHINDVLAKSVNSTTLEIHDLQLALPYVSAIATGFGRSMEEVSAALGVMRDNGIAAETTGRAMREMFAKLSNPVKGTVEVFDKLGISLAEVDPTMHTVAEIIGVLEAKGLSAADSLKAFGDAAGPGIFAMTRTGGEALARLTEELEKSDGSARQMADAMMVGLPGALERLKGSTETAWIAISKAIEPTVIRVMDALGNLADIITNYVVPAFSGLPAPIQLGVLGLLAFMAAIGPIVGIAGVVLSSLGSIGAAFGAAGTAAGGASVMVTGLGTALSMLPGVLAVVATGVAAWNIGGWIGEMSGATEWVGRLTARVGELVGLLPEGTGAVYDFNQTIESTLPPVKALDLAKAGLIPKVDFLARANANLTEQLARGSDAAFELTSRLRAEKLEFEQLTPAMKAKIASTLELGGSVSEIAEAFGLAESTVRRYKEALDESKKATDEATKLMEERIASLQSKFLQQNAAVGKVTTSFQTLGVGTNSLATWFATLNNVQTTSTQQQGLAEAAALKWAQTNGAVLAPSITGIGEELKQLELEAQAARLARFGEAAGKVGKAIQQAIQGGGNVGKAAGASIGGQLGEWAGKAAGPMLGKMLGSTLGSTVGSALGPVGTMIGGFLGDKVGSVFGKLFGGNKEKKQVDAMRKDMLRVEGGMEALQAKAAKAGVSLDRLFNAKKVDDYNRALQEVQAGLDRHAERMNLAKQAAEEFGIPAEKMSEAFKQAESDTAGFDLLDKITALMESGMDIGTLVEYAGDDVAAFIQRAMEMGTKVPLEFQKIAEQMIKNGTLQVVDAKKLEELTQRKIDLEADLAEAMKDSSVEGVKKQEELKAEIVKTNADLEKTKTTFDSLDDIPWAENLNTMFEGLMTKLGQFIDMIADGLGGALNGLPTDVGINFNASGSGNGNSEPPQMAAGGIVTRATHVIAGEAGPEAIIPLGNLDAMFGQANKDNSGSAMFNITLMVDGKKLTDIVLDNAGSRLATRGGVGR